MPYITQERRQAINGGAAPENAGELNYQLTELVQDYFAERAWGYATINDVLGVLTAMQLEIYRRLVAPYEDIKCNDNGDVFPRTEETHV